MTIVKRLCRKKTGRAVKDEEPHFRRVIRKYLKDNRMSMAELSTEAGLHPTYISQALSKRIPKIDTMSAIAHAMNMSVGDLIGENPADYATAERRRVRAAIEKRTSQVKRKLQEPRLGLAVVAPPEGSYGYQDAPTPQSGGEQDDEAKPAIKTAPVVGEVAAGLWLDMDNWDTPKYNPAPFVPGKFQRMNQSAYLVRGTSMNRRYPDGSYVITVPYFDVRGELREGDPVVVERVDGGRIERTVKLVIVDLFGIALACDSTDPKWEDTRIPIPNGEPDEVADTEIRILGLVIGSYRPENV
jgi:lambda repressor-like predicted transcriptional regulator/SOS-response transcriptional repressor LexA